MGKAGGGKTGRSTPWWGAGDSPGDIWPETTIDIPVVWRSAGSRWETPDGRFYFDESAAARAQGFFPDLLTHHIGEFAGKPFELMEYQIKLLTRPLFGWKRTADGLRRFRKVFAFIPKGGGKSPWAAGTGVYLARCDGEMAAEVYALANDRGQARTVHNNAKYMVEDQPLLSKGCEILKDSIYWTNTRSMFQVLSSDAASAHGKRPHGLMVDELHGFNGDRDRELFEALKKSMVKRRQPVLAMITHSGTDEEGICREEYDYAKGVIDGLIQDDTCLPVVFEARKGDDWRDPVVHARVNPGYGVTVKPEAIEAECLEAQHEPRKQNDFKRYYLNIWVNQASAWIPIEWWDACKADIQDAELLSFECAAGLDLAQKWDLAAFVVAFRRYLGGAAEEIDVLAEDETGSVAPRRVSLNYELLVRPFFWIPEDTMREHQRQDGVPYQDWVDAGLVTATEGSVIDYSRIYSDIITKILPRFPRLKEGLVGYDPAFATDLATKLRDVGGLKVAEILQNYTHISEPSQIVEALIKGRRVRHDGHQVLRWNWSNVTVKTDDAGRIRPKKPKNPSKRVDGAVAMIMADKALSLSQPEAEPEYQLMFVGGTKR